MSNDPGLPAIAYRSGTQASVLRRMVAALGSRLPGLAGAAIDDPAIGLLDAWATVADVVTFYQERIANEGYLRTATEGRSVLELARAIGYELRPGVSASTFLDVRMQVATGPAATPPAAPTTASAPRGTRVLSVPAQGQVPQTFETSDDLTVAVDRNEILPRRARPQTFQAGRTRYYVVGTTTGLRPGDAILIAQAPAEPDAVPATSEFRVLRSVVVQPASAADLPASTLLTWDDGLTQDYPYPLVRAFGLRAALFGYNAPDWRTLPLTVKQQYTKDSSVQAGSVWPGFALGGSVIELDAPHPDLEPGSLLMLKQPGLERLYQVRSAELDAQQDFAISAKTTRIGLDSDHDVASFDRRAAAVYTQTRLLEPAGEPIGGTTTGPAFDLLAPASLAVGQQVIVTGSADGASLTEPARVVSTTPLAAVTHLVLDHALPRPVALDSVRILGNVVTATHGETVPEEVLGSGDGTVPNQRFTLRKKGLTQLPTPAGAAGVTAGVTAALDVRVDGVLWTKVASLYPAGPHDREYVVRIDDDGFATLMFGDGEHGARLPSGQENVRASYRFGVGPDGEVAAHALTLLPQRPLGVSTVDNPLPAGGASAPEVLADARTNAPLTVLTLDRVVSLPDYENYVRAFGGIAKARAVAIQGRGAAFVHLTLAGPAGGTVQQDTIGSLLASLDLVRDRAVPVRAASLRLTLFRAGVAILADAALVAADVRQAVRLALLDAWSVERRSFGQPATMSDILTVAQQVVGVTAARVTELRRTEADPLINAVLSAQDAHLQPTQSDPDRVVPAELLLIDPAQLVTTEMAP